MRIAAGKRLKSLRSYGHLNGSHSSHPLFFTPGFASLQTWSASLQDIYVPLSTAVQLTLLSGYLRRWGLVCFATCACVHSIVHMHCHGAWTPCHESPCWTDMSTTVGVNHMHVLKLSFILSVSILQETLFLRQFHVAASCHVHIPQTCAHLCPNYYSFPASEPEWMKNYIYNTKHAINNVLQLDGTISLSIRLWIVRASKVWPNLAGF